MRKLLVLSLTIFVVVMSELQIAGMMPELAADMHVTIDMVGLLVSAYSLGMAVGGPLLAYLLRHAAPKKALLMLIAAYAGFELLVPAVHQYWWILALRIITGCLSGAAFGLSLSFGIRIAADPARIGRSVSIVLGGMMAGTVIGLPASHAIAAAWDWQASFLMMGTAALTLFVVGLASLPDLSPVRTDDAAQDLLELRSRALWSRYATSFLTIGAAYGSFSYFTPLLAEKTGLSSGVITVILLGYGICSVVGNLIVGKLADRNALVTLWVGQALIGFSLCLLALFADVAPAAITLVLLVGMSGVSMNPALATRIAEVGGTGSLVTTLHTAVITLGIAGGTAASALAMRLLGDDPVVAMWVGVGLAAIAMATLLAQRKPAGPMSGAGMMVRSQ